MVADAGGEGLGRWERRTREVRRDHPVKDRLAAAAAFLGEAISPRDHRGERV